MPPVPLPRKVGGHDPPASMGAPPLQGVEGKGRKKRRGKGREDEREERKGERRGREEKGCIPKPPDQTLPMIIRLDRTYYRVFKHCDSGGACFSNNLRDTNWLHIQCTGAIYLFNVFEPSRILLIINQFSRWLVSVF